MKKFLIALSLLGLAGSASADFFGGNNGQWKTGPYGPYWEENDWPEWTPMYWMQEMSDSFNDDGNGNGFNFGNSFSNGNMPFFGNNNYGNYGMPMMPYGYNNYQMPMMPYGVAPMPYYGIPNAQAPMMQQPMPMPAAPVAPVNTAPGPSTPTTN
ncbi:MAG: hypothetical protein WBP46_13095 [Thiolinea sp.]